MNNNYKYGYICSSDGHKGNPGRNGLTAVYSKELTRKSILEGIRARRCYGTTNARIKLLFMTNDSMMGSVVPNTSVKEFYILVEGENQLKCIDLYKNGELHKRFRHNDVRFETRLSLNDSEASSWYVRVTQIDNHMAYSSPIWFE